MVNQTPPIVVMDACVLASTIRRHVTLSFAQMGLFYPIWSERILFETRRAIPKTLGNSDISPESANAHAGQICRLLNWAFPAALRALPDGLPEADLPDEDDLHVLALSLAHNAKIILTENLRDFPKRALAPHQIEAQSTDAFLASLVETKPALARTAISRLRERLGVSDIDEARILARMKVVGLRKTVQQFQAE